MLELTKQQWGCVEGQQPTNADLLGAITQVHSEFKNLSKQIDTLETRVSKLEKAPCQGIGGGGFIDNIIYCRGLFGGNKPGIL